MKNLSLQRQKEKSGKMTFWNSETETAETQVLVGLFYFKIIVARDHESVTGLQEESELWNISNILLVLTNFEHLDSEFYPSVSVRWIIFKYNMWPNLGKGFTLPMTLKLS